MASAFGRREIFFLETNSYCDEDGEYEIDTPEGEHPDPFGIVNETDADEHPRKERHELKPS